MKKTLAIVIILILLFSSCTQQTAYDEATAEPTAEITPEITTEITPTFTPEITSAYTTETTIDPENILKVKDYDLKPFESYYTELEEINEKALANNEPIVITDEHWDMLHEMYDLYGIVMKFDKEFALGTFSYCQSDLNEKNYDDAIEIFYELLNELNLNKTESTTRLLRDYLTEVYSVYSLDNVKGRSSGQEILVAFGSLLTEDGAFSNRLIEGTYVSEMANLWIENKNLDLTEFRSCSEELKGTSVDDLWDAGYLNLESVTDELDDCAYVFAGILTNYNKLWADYIDSYLYDSNKTFFNKVNVGMNLLESINPEWTPEYLITNYCYKTFSKGDGPKYNSWEIFSEYFD